MHVVYSFCTHTHTLPYSKKRVNFTMLLDCLKITTPALGQLNQSPDRYGRCVILAYFSKDGFCIAIRNY